MNVHTISPFLDNPPLISYIFLDGSEMADNAITITYTYRFTSGAEKSFDLRLDGTTLALQKKQ